MTTERPPQPGSSVWKPGQNCWRVESADRAAFLIDGDAYFRAFRSAVLQARESVFILAWDIHTQVRLLRSGPDDAGPVSLVSLLNQVARSRPGLHIHVLSWDFAMVYAMEREWLPALRFRWKTHRRVQVHLDSEHPIAASHHQKVVVIDDRVAFAGGLDVSVWRWDTPFHLADDPRRIDPSGKPYAPFHDVQMVVEGAAASALGDLARDRWRRATGQRIRPTCSREGSSPWPTGVSPALRGVDIAIARTAPPFRGQPAVREVEQLYFESIRSARRFVYLENQYLSSRRLAAALGERLAEANGPEVVIVLPLRTGGWLEQHTMDMLRAGALRALRQADRHGRLRVYYPVVQGRTEVPVYVHSKVEIVDDEFCRVGSANLSNRSMRLDTECDLAFRAHGSETGIRAIRNFRRRLLADHLGLEHAASEAVVLCRSLIEGIETHRRTDGTTLKPLSVELSSEWEEQLASADWLDPEEPMDPECLVGDLVQADERSALQRRLCLAAVVIVLLLTVAGLWRWGPLGAWTRDAGMEAVFRAIEGHPLTPVLATLIVAVAASVGMPMTLLLGAAAVLFGPWLGFLYAYTGAQLSALAVFFVGNKLGTGAARQLAGRRWSHLSRLLAERGVLVVALVRMLPVAPFTVVNIVAGASPVSWRDFALGTSMGMIPGMLVVALLADRLRATMQAPSGLHVLALVVVAVIAVGGIAVLHRWVRRSMRAKGEGQEKTPSADVP